MARERHRAQPVSPPRANPATAPAQPIADRPRTGTTVTTVTAAETARNNPAEPHAWRCTAHHTGTVEAATTTACHPVSPRNQPTRALEYSS